MSIINSVLGLFLGNKYEQDIKDINPYIDKTHAEYAKLQTLSNDELRNSTDELRAEILSSIAEDENEIAVLRDRAEKEEDVNAKEELYNSIDKNREADQREA